ncbi:PREDICTED: protein lunapark, partial [Gekko japonicus]|uniref:Endoplasmic reticulum junction formation protein lunapark n=1 Tax=Gekko japonicus TaxID=146911 RepID=A0ABM1LC96_GEKJA
NVRQDERIIGVKIKGASYKLRAFADDLMLVLEDPLKGIETLMAKLKEFGTVVGIKQSINFLGLHPPGPPLARQILPRERGTLDRIVEYLVGDGPQNRYALICQQCFSHNGMALKEEFDYIAFRCAYCFFLNPARKTRPQAPRLLDYSAEKKQPTELQKTAESPESEEEKLQESQMVDEPLEDDPPVTETDQGEDKALSTEEHGDQVEGEAETEQLASEGTSAVAKHESIVPADQREELLADAE